MGQPKRAKEANGSPQSHLVSLAALVVVVAGLKAAQKLLVPFLLAVFLAILAAPGVSWLRKRRVPTAISVLLVVLLMVGIITLMGTLLGGTINEFTAALPKYKARLRGMTGDLLTWMENHGFSFPEEKKFASTVDPSAVLDLLTKALGGMVAAASNAVLVFLTMVFILLEAAGFPTKLRAAIGGANADIGRFEAVTVEVQRYLLLKTAISILTGILIGIWCALLGLDFAALWALLAFLLNYIPNLGSIIAAVPAVLLALVQLGVGKALAVAAGYLAVNMVLGNIVEPQLMGRRLGLSPLVVFLSLVFWGWVWGPVGMLLSVPLTMIAKILLEASPEGAWIAVLLDSTAGAQAALESSGQQKAPAAGGMEEQNAPGSGKAR